jgi:adenylate cyclase
MGRFRAQDGVTAYDEVRPEGRGEANELDISALRGLGITDEAIERAVERGDPEGAIFDAILLPTIAERTVSAAQVEAAGGLSTSEIAALVEAFGLPAPDPTMPLLTQQEADVLLEVGRTQDIWPLEVRIRVARVMGRQLACIARAQVQQFFAHFESELTAAAGDRVAALQAVHSAAARLLPLSEHFLLGVHRRWLEHELAQAAVGQAESAAAGVPLPGAVDVTIVFCDLKDFTAYADLQGDAAAVEAIDTFTEIVLNECGEQLRAMKSLGDGFMLCYGDVHQAVAAAARILAGMRDAHGPGAHASVHRGVAIARDGDYFGSAVNLAARLLAAARRDQLVATASVARATDTGLAWVPAGVLRMRGFAEPIETFCLAV